MVKLVATVRHNRDLSVEDALGIPDVARIVGVHPRTIQRRRQTSKAPRPLQAQREDKLRTIWQELVGFFGTENAIYWLQHSVPAFGDRPPIDIMLEDGGLDRVLDTVGHELGHSDLRPDLRTLFRCGPVVRFSDTVLPHLCRPLCV